MSRRKRGQSYEVRWNEGGRKRSRSFARSSDADAFETEVRRRKQLGPLAPSIIQSKVTLAEFMEEEWWPRYAIPNLDEDTRRRYLEVWGKDLLPRVGAYKLREITPLVVEDLRDQLINRGLAVASVLKALHLLSAILKRAAVRGLIPANPVDVVAKPSSPPAAPPRPLTPLIVEKIRAVMLEPRTRTVPAAAQGKRPRRAYEAQTGSPTERQRNALIVSMLAYGGFRPIEDRNAEWRDLHNHALRVYATKTRRERYVDLLAPLAEDLAEWRLTCGDRTDGLIVSRPSGGAWRREDWANWRRRVYQPAARAAGVTGDLRRYRLRGSFVSLLLWAGEDLVYVADQAGHSVATLARHYAGVIRELRDVTKMAAAELILSARKEVAATNGTHTGRTRS